MTKLAPTAITAALTTLVGLAPAQVEDAAQNPVELGRVAWHRGFGEATRIAKEKDRPLLVLFQEVPG